MNGHDWVRVSKDEASHRLRVWRCGRCGASWVGVRKPSRYTRVPRSINDRALTCEDAVLQLVHES